MSRTLIIAEAGVNHDGDMVQAKKLIDVAVEAGADVVKFQTFKADRLVSAQAPKAQYQLETTDRAETQHEMLRRLELKTDDHHLLAAHCRDQGIEFLSTGFDRLSVDFLVEMGVKRIKIPSGEIANLPYLRHVAKSSLPIILSTGMACIGEVEDAVEVLEAVGMPSDQLTLLHCNTQYPTPFSDVNLRAMATLQRSFPEAKVGYSDHTTGIEVSIAAVAMGATVIEKHFTLSRDGDGPDHKASLEPNELADLVRAVRHVEESLGDGRKRASASERENIGIARKSIVAASDIKTGDLFSEENLAAKRPGTGISPMRWDELIGRTANRDFQKDDLIEW